MRCVQANKTYRVYLILIFLQAHLWHQRWGLRRVKEWGLGRNRCRVSVELRLERGSKGQRAPENICGRFGGGWGGTWKQSSSALSPFSSLNTYTLNWFDVWVRACPGLLWGLLSTRAVLHRHIPGQGAVSPQPPAPLHPSCACLPSQPGCWAGPHKETQPLKWLPLAEEHLSNPAEDI